MATRDDKSVGPVDDEMVELCAEGMAALRVRVPARRLRGSPTSTEGRVVAFDDHKNSARDGDTSGRPTNTEATVPVEPTLDQLAEAREGEENGKRLAVPSLIEELSIGAYLQDQDDQAADEQREAVLDARAGLIRLGATIPLDDEHTHLHRRVNDLVNGLDDLRAMLAERRSS
jgi:hypothetical protein